MRNIGVIARQRRYSKPLKWMTGGSDGNSSKSLSGITTSQSGPAKTRKRIQVYPHRRPSFRLWS